MFQRCTLLALIFETHSNANSTNFLSLSLHTKVINYVIWSRSLLTRLLLLSRKKKVLQSHNIGTARIATHIRTINSIHTSNKQHPLEIIMPMVRVCNVRNNEFVCVQFVRSKIPLWINKKEFISGLNV